MRFNRVYVWVGRGAAFSLLALPLSGCVATLPATAASASPPVATALLPSDDDDFSQLVAQLRMDLNRNKSREVSRAPAVAGTTPPPTREHDRQFAERAKALFAPLTALRMPVVGLTPRDLEDSWGAPRDGGARSHQGIDIFAPRGTELIAVTDGVISYIGDQPKGGHCLWLTTENGASFYYAHLDRWAAGLYEGMEVQSGDLLGYVGNTGNAINTPCHLHFGVHEADRPVNPYPLLRNSIPTRHANVHAASSRVGR
jgi:murein DD-endopeptidase MepM/ murein hydrolase activator NlpD